MKRIKELYKRYSEWEVEDFYFHFGDMSIKTNRITVFIGMLILLGIFRLLIK